MIILGIDPGLANTGWGIIEQKGSSVRCLAYGCIVTRAGEPVAQRLALAASESEDAYSMRPGLEAVVWVTDELVRAASKPKGSSE